MQAFIFVYLSFTSRYLGLVFQCSCIPISSSKYKKDTFSFYVVMHFPFQLRSITSSCPSGAFFRYSHFWLLYGFRIGSDRYGAGFCDEPLMRYQQHLLRDRTTAARGRHWPLRAPFALRGDGRSLREEARAGARVRPQGGIIAA